MADTLTKCVFIHLVEAMMVDSPQRDATRFVALAVSILAIVICLVYGNCWMLA
ncbi:MAG: hypothetical protein KME45_29695 [Stenomitos rutilans HA7619-LM2]|nr:hypothetical protein [Stenomitos rutilans HA7619-LM2]